MRPRASDLPRMTLVLGGTGKTGGRVAERLWNAGGPVRLGHRTNAPRFDWTDPATWAPALAGADAVFVAYQPDIGLPEAAGRVAAFADAARAAGARRLVLLSRRGAPAARPAEEALKASGDDWTVIRASALMQNFTEGPAVPRPTGGSPRLPAGAAGEPFVDAGDVADVALRVFADPDAVGRTLDLAGPHVLSVRDALAALASAGRAPQTPPARRRGAGDVEAILGRPARTFADFAAEAAGPPTETTRLTA